MAIWTMEVFLRRDLHGDAERQTLRAALPNLTAVAYETGRSQAALVLEVEASSRADAEETARRAVAAALHPADIERVGGTDDIMQNRQVMLWLIGTRRQIRRWEVVLAANVKAHLANAERPAPTIWEAQIERHLALVSANNLLRALENADGRFSMMPGNMAEDVRNQRDMQEHWDEQWPPFYSVNDPGPLKRGGRLFAVSHPGGVRIGSLVGTTSRGPSSDRAFAWVICTHTSTPSNGRSCRSRPSWRGSVFRQTRRRGLATPTQTSPGGPGNRESGWDRLVGGSG